MIKKIEGMLRYEDSPSGDSARNNLESTITSELQKNTVVPELPTNEAAQVTNNNTSKIVSFTIFYVPTNAGISDFNAFWGTLETELDNPLVIFNSYVKKCNSFHDVGLVNGPEEVLTK